MSNKIALATIQFRADAKGVNPALDAMRASAKDAHDEMDRMQAALDRGIKTMKDANGVEFDVAKRFNEARKQAVSFDKAVRELVKGATALETVVQNIRLGEIEKSSRAELKGAINAAEARKRSVRETDPEDLQQQRELNQVIEESRKQLNNLDRDTQKVIETLDKGGTIAQAALDKEMKGLREMLTLIPKGTEEWNKYNQQLQQMEAHVANIRRQELQQASDLLGSKDFGQYSENQLREAIEAGKQLIQTYQTASPEAEKLAKKIVAAEQHLKQYGVESERAAQREAEAIKKTAEERKKADDLMKQQLQQGTSLSKEALQAQEQYWQRLINDPKTAAASLQDYQLQLDKVHRLQRMMVYQEGVAAIDFFRGDTSNASADEIQRQAKALKLLRDALPQKDNAALIKEIDELLQKAGQSAKKAAEQTMSWKQAMQVSSQAGAGSFRGTVEQLTQAKKVLEEMSAKAVKGGLAWRRMQEALQRIEIELKNVGHLSQDVQDVLDKPKGRSYNQLKQAVEKGRAALNAMDRTTREGQKAFDELAKKVKAADLEMKQLAGTAKGTVSAFDKAWSRLKTYVGLYVGAAVAMQKLTATMGDLMELSDKMGEVRKTTGFTADEVGRLTTSLKKLDTRTSIVGLLDLSAAAGQLGLKTQEDVEGFTIAANKLMVALPEMGREGATEMLKVALATGEIDKIRRQMEEGLIDGSSATAVAMEKVGSTIDRLRATSAATAPAITDFVKRVGAVGAQSGITIDQVAALGSTVDALGMRVEMSATALSRMIPAIRNNAYSIGAMIGQTEEEIIRKFDNGMGMDVILDIFETIRNNSRAMTGDVEQDAGEIEKMFERAGLQDIMKELNQMGARAGIVFAGLSQNVDELRRQLGVAAEAYEENIAIEQEYQKMNDTTAAKWERLKNQLEEAFVGDTAQRWLGGIIDGLRKFIDLLTGEGGVSDAFRTILVYIAAVRLGLAEGIVKALTSVWTGIKNIGVALGIVKGQMQAMNYANIFMAIGAAVLYATKCFGLLGKEVSFADRELAKADKAIAEATEKLERMFIRLEKTTTELNRATEATLHAKEGSEEAAEAQDKLALATENHKRMVDAINSNYASYLGFMLTEYDRAELIAAAHDKITASLKREMYAKQQQQSLQAVQDEYNPKILDEWADTRKELREKGVSGEVISDTFEKLQNILDNTKWNPNDGNYSFYNGTYEELAKTLGEETVMWTNDLGELIAQYMYKHLAELTNLTAEQLQDITGVIGLRSTERGKVYSRNAEAGFTTSVGDMSNVRQGLMDVYTDFIQKRDDITDIFNRSVGRWAKEEREKSLTLIDELKLKAETQLNTISTTTDQSAIDTAYRELAQALLGLDNQIKILDRETDKAIIDSITALADKASNSTDATKLTAARAGALSIFARATATNTNTENNSNYDSNNPRGPYGNYDKRVDPYEQWDANALVKRREDMLKRVRALAGGADVQQVLSMDKRFMDEATRKGIKNMRDAIAWYNEERLKIQEELHNRNLTNEGQWMDPRSGGSKRKPKTPESEEAIAELDRYYLERKERIEEARANEEMTEAEYNRRLDALEQEHLERRSALRQTFTSEDKQFIQQFRQWWASVAELDEVSWETIEAEWIAAFDRDRKYNNRAAQKDLTAMQAITVKQLREIEAIIDKERPFNGITRNLQDNLTKMGILFKDGVDDSNFMEQNTKRLTFLLREAEDAYNMTWEQLERDMRGNGLGAWADAIVGSDNAEKEKRAVIAQLHEVYDAVQEAIKKEASLVKKQVDITWNDALLPNGKSIKQTYEAAISQLGVQQGSVSRANSLIGAGTASARVADRLAIRQMQIQLQMQEHYYNLVRQTGMQRIADLREQARQLREQGELDKAARLDLDAQHATMSLNLSLSKEQTELDKQREGIIARTEESQNRLYTSLREWAELLSSSVQSLFEASHAGDAEYYNERAKLNLTGKGGPGAGTYVVIDDAGTSDAKAHYEYLDERQALEREHEIEKENAMAEAWRKVMDDLNAKMNEQITDWMNAALQNASIDANTDAMLQNTEALAGLTNAIAASSGANAVGDAGAAAGTAAPVAAGEGALSPAEVQEWTDALGTEPWLVWEQAGVSAMQHVQQTTADTSKRMQASTQSAFAKMTQAANLYGIAYSAMSNDNLSTTQKFEMMAVQAAGQAAISMLTADLAAGEAKNSVQLPGILGKLLGEMPFPAAMATFAIVTGLLGGLMGLAVSKITKSKSQIAQATGASGANAGKLTTGMLTYAEGNVNEFTDPASLTPGRQYNVDGADGKTYRARYMGKGAKTHITNGPEFHLVGEAGREAIIDAKTTRQIQMDEPGIWKAIKTLYRGGRLSPVRRRGMAAFADGNIDELEEMGADGIAAYGTGGAGGMSPEQMAAFQSSLDRNNELLERALNEGIKGVFDVHGAHGLVNTYDTAKREALRHGERYT